MVKNKNKLVILPFLATFALSIATSSILSVSKVTAGPTITITSPSPNQSIPGTSFTVKGTSTPNTTIVVSSSGTSFGQTVSDSSGNWLISSTLPAGNINLTAKAIQNPTYGYFPTTPDFQDYKINRIRLSDNAINPGGSGWPITSTLGVLGLVPSNASFFYTVNPFNANTSPGKFNPNDTVDSVATTNYPANYRSNKGAFTKDNAKYYSSNMDSPNISVIDTTSNDWLEDIPIGEASITSWASPAGKIYSVLGSNKLKVIDTSTNTVSKTITVPCATPDSTSTITFSQEVNYPYYFVPCNNDGTFIKFKVSDDSYVNTLNVGLAPTTGALSLDNKRLFFSSVFGNADSNKIRVVNVEDGSVITTKTMTSGVLGILATSDFQNIYATTPGNNVDTQNIDIMNTTTYDVTSVATNGISGAVSTLPTETSETAVQVAFVLGATTTTASGTLAETGALAISAIVLLLIILLITGYLYSDYRKHKKPLVEINPNVHYTFAHHVKMVNIPLLKYRLTFKFEKKRNNNLIT